MLAIQRRPAAARQTTTSTRRPEPPVCGMGTAARDMCMRDPNRLAQWPNICRICNEDRALRCPS
jgi:hypothetical protein